MGILVKSVQALEATRQLQTIVLDKTGTITEGCPKVVDLLVFDGFSEQQMLCLAGSLEQGSEHPFCPQHWWNAPETEEQSCLPVKDFQAAPGHGARGRINGREVAVGNDTMMQGVPASEAQKAEAEKIASAGKTPVWVAVDGRYMGLVGVADELRASSAADIANLKRSGLEIVMLTGGQPQCC